MSHQIFLLSILCVHIPCTTHSFENIWLSCDDLTKSSLATGDWVVDLVGLRDEFGNGFVHLLFGEVVEVNSSLNAKIVTSHHIGVCTHAFSNNEWSLWCLTLDIQVIVLDELACTKTTLSLLTKHKSQFFHTLAQHRSVAHFTYLFFCFIK